MQVSVFTQALDHFFGFRYVRGCVQSTNCLLYSDLHCIFLCSELSCPYFCTKKYSCSRDFHPIKKGKAKCTGEEK